MVANSATVTLAAVTKDSTGIVTDAKVPKATGPERATTRAAEYIGCGWMQEQHPHPVRHGEKNVLLTSPSIGPSLRSQLRS